jgi:hypothetical protein
MLKGTAICKESGFWMTGIWLLQRSICERRKPLKGCISCFMFARKQSGDDKRTWASVRRAHAMATQVS